MVAAPEWRGQPLHVPGRPGDGVLRHGIAAGVVQVVRPLVDLVRTGLDRLRPRAALLDVGHAVGREDPHHLGHADRAEVPGDEKVDEVVDVRQARARPPLDRHLAGQAERLDVPAGLLDVRLVGIEAVDEIGIARAECGRQFAVAAADVDDQAAGDACGVQDLFRIHFLSRRGR